jgi:hypothetical protein
MRCDRRLALSGPSLIFRTKPSSTLELSFDWLRPHRHPGWPTRNDKSGSLEAAARLCYDRLLARAPDENDVREVTRIIEEKGWNAATDKLVYGSEFYHRFGPTHGAVPPHSPEMKLTWQRPGLLNKYRTRT